MAYAGLKSLVRHRAGHRLTQRQAILAKCGDCMGGYTDGRQDCEIPGCPLYPFQPYRQKGRGRGAGCGRSVAKPPDFEGSGAESGVSGRNGGERLAQLERSPGRQPTQKSYSGNAATVTGIARSATVTIHSAKAVQCFAGPEAGAMP